MERSVAPISATDRGVKSSASRSGVTNSLPPGGGGSGWGGSSSFWQAEGALAHDVALDLAGPGVDGAGPAAQERGLPAVGGVAVALGPDQRLGPEHVH